MALGYVICYQCSNCTSVICSCNCRVPVMNSNIIKWECNCLELTFHIESVLSVRHVSIFDTNLHGYIQLFNFIKLLPVLKYYIMHGFKLRHAAAIVVAIYKILRGLRSGMTTTLIAFSRVFSQYKGSQCNHSHNHNFKPWCRVHKVMHNIFEGHTSDREPRCHVWYPCFKKLCIKYVKDILENQIKNLTNKT
jgi:hypothetical protein